MKKAPHIIRHPERSEGSKWGFVWKVILGSFVTLRMTVSGGGA